MRAKQELVKMCSSAVTSNYLLNIWDAKTIETNESVYLLLVGDGMRPIYHTRLATGTEDTCNFDIQQVLRLAIEHRAHGIFLAHNHPAGNPSPSKTDIETTQSLFNKCEVIGIRLFDHIIVTPSGKHASLLDLGYLDQYEQDFTQAQNTSTAGTYEHTVLKLLKKAFTEIDNRQSKDYVFKRLQENLDKVYIKWFEIIC